MKIASSKRPNVIPGDWRTQNNTYERSLDGDILKQENSKTILWKYIENLATKKSLFRSYTVKSQQIGIA